MRVDFEESLEQGLRFTTTLTRSHLYVLVSSFVLMARGVRSMGETGCKLLIRSATGMREGVLGTTSSAILCGQVLPSTQRLRTCAPLSTQYSTEPA